MQNPKENIASYLSSVDLPRTMPFMMGTTERDVYILQFSGSFLMRTRDVNKHRFKWRVEIDKVLSKIW